MTDFSIIHELGDPDGFPVVFHNGTPCSRLLPEWWDAPARERGLRLISIDRAGYGNAPAEPDRSLRSVAESTAALMDELGVDRFAVIGVSGGGPYALACGAFLPERVVAVISGAGSSGFDKAIDGAGFDPEELELTREQALRPTPEGRQELARFYDPEVENLRSADVDGLMRAVGGTRRRPRRSSGRPPHTCCTRSRRGCDPAATGGWTTGWRWFGHGASSPPISASRSRCGTARTTRMVAIEHGRRLVAAIPNAEPFLVDGLGHGGVCCRQEVPMFDWLVSKVPTAGRA